MTGYCIQGKHVHSTLSKRECYKMPSYKFISFDISGHAFLMTYCILCMAEESKVLFFILALQMSINDRLKSQPTLSFPQKNYRYLILIIFSAYFIFILSLIWDLMLIITTLFYHTLTEKLLGITLSVSMWYISYPIIFTIFNVL